jgi:hypothetical protein
VPRQIPLSRQSTFVDTGTWAPIFDSPPGKPPKLRPGLRNYLIASFAVDREPQLELGSWIDQPA